MDAELERSFDLFGSRVRTLIGVPRGEEARSTELAALETEALLQRLHRELSRFDPESGLSALNADPSETVAVSAAVGSLVRAAIEAERASGGLVDSAVVESLELNGYALTRVGLSPAPLEDALAWAPPRHAAGPSREGVWGAISVSEDGTQVTRPPGLRIDSGGLGKGLAADLAGERLARFSTFAVDCGGDLRIGGTDGSPRRVEVEHPFDRERGISFEVTGGAVATSGLRTRIWTDRGGYAHHLIDPATGTPAWTGVVQATALAPTAIRAETLAKSAVLGGPARARSILAPRGGVLVLDSGEVEVLGEVEVAEKPPLIGAR